MIDYKTLEESVELFIKYNKNSDFKIICSFFINFISKLKCKYKSFIGADDINQICMLAIFKATKKYQKSNVGTFYGFCKKVMINEVLMILRKRYLKEKAYDINYENTYDAALINELELENTVYLSNIKSKVKNLNNLQSRIIYMNFFQKKNLNEISKELKSSVYLIKKQKQFALEILKRELQF